MLDRLINAVTGQVLCVSNNATHRAVNRNVRPRESGFQPETIASLMAGFSAAAKSASFGERSRPNTRRKRKNRLLAHGLCRVAARLKRKHLSNPTPESTIHPCRTSQKYSSPSMASFLGDFPGFTTCHPFRSIRGPLPTPDKRRYRTSELWGGLVCWRSCGGRIWRWVVLHEVEDHFVEGAVAGVDADAGAGDVADDDVDAGAGGAEVDGGHGAGN